MFNLKKIFNKKQKIIDSLICGKDKSELSLYKILDFIKKNNNLKYLEKNNKEDFFNFLETFRDFYFESKKEEIFLFLDIIEESSENKIFKKYIKEQNILDNLIKDAKTFFLVYDYCLENYLSIGFDLLIEKYEKFMVELPYSEAVNLQKKVLTNSKYEDIIKLNNALIFPENVQCYIDSYLHKKLEAEDLRHILRRNKAYLYLEVQKFLLENKFYHNFFKEDILNNLNESITGNSLDFETRKKHFNETFSFVNTLSLNEEYDFLFSESFENFRSYVVNFKESFEEDFDFVLRNNLMFFKDFIYKSKNTVSINMLISDILNESSSKTLPDLLDFIKKDKKLNECILENYLSKFLFSSYKIKNADNFFILYGFMQNNLPDRYNKCLEKMFSFSSLKEIDIYKDRYTDFLIKLSSYPELSNDILTSFFNKVLNMNAIFSFISEEEAKLKLKSSLTIEKLFEVLDFNKIKFSFVDFLKSPESEFLTPSNFELLLKLEVKNIDKDIVCENKYRDLLINKDFESAYKFYMLNVEKKVLFLNTENDFTNKPTKKRL